MDKKFISDIAVQTLLLTIVSITGIYFYELGFCRYFGIPSEFITIEINKYSGLLFTFLATFFISSLAIDSLLGHFIIFLKIRKWYIRLIVVLIFISIIIFSFKDFLKYLAFQEMLTLGLVFLFGATLILNTNKSDDSYDTISPKYSLNIFLSRKTGSTFGPTLILSSTICAFLFCIGFYSGQTKTTFAVRSDNKTILLRKYGDIIIYGSTINGKVIEIAISDSKVDTLHMTKFK